MIKHFESLEDYNAINSNKLVKETLLLEADENNKSIGNIIDRGLSFMPRIIRFKKAQKTIKKALKGYINKSNTLIGKFSQSFQNKINIIDKEYKDLVKTRITPLIKAEKGEQAVKLMESQLKELEQYKSEQMGELNQGIDNVLAAYTKAIQSRIDTPGFVLNVELSEKGKGELMAKWESLVAQAKMKIDEKKTTLIKSSGWKQLNNIISEVTSFIEERKYQTGRHALDFEIQSINTTQTSNLSVKIFLRGHGRPKVKEKGVIIGPDPEQLKYKAGSNIIKHTGGRAKTFAGWDTIIPKGNEENYIVPYIIFQQSSKPQYGNSVLIKDLVVKQDIDKQETVIQPDLDKETNIIPPGNK